ncbi:M20 family metallo-hydrolase [Ammonifex thiophilus]|uniref:M20 family metallo-hydrolase n=1 Tax=Ammonifex thiophilus TaxID=444093 RepID=A0A3D8P6D8_9THEO|nr:M20 family metallo-hydrolase [Ammonifex thiophilus]RDV84302.1 M20 family metallo-hydrolase [Ammonifex thiophilus]
MVDPRVLEEVERLRGEMVEALVELIKIPALSPDNGGEGELRKAEKLEEIIRQWPFDRIERYDAPDPRALNGIRPNLLAYYYGEQGEQSPRLWILTHLDVVPPGDLEKWTETSPFNPLLKEGKVYGRGSEDNGQSLVASLYAVRALMNLGLRPKRTFVLAFVSDEETGNRYGIEWLMKNHPELFRREDLVLVPDGGNREGTFIEIAEKSLLWLKVKVEGKQVHGSTPHKGFNAFRVALDYARVLDQRLHEKFDVEDELFEYPISSFEPTMGRSLSDAPNIIPGEAEVVFDCRVLPCYRLDEILHEAETLARRLEGEYRRELGERTFPRIKLEVLQQVESPATPSDSPIVKLLRRAIRELRGKEARVGGIGGGTFAAYFRRLGIPAAVWGTFDELAHQPNEYARIDNLVEDAKVMAYLGLAAEI